MRKNNMTKIVALANKKGFNVYAVDRETGTFYGCLACDNFSNKFSCDKTILINENETLYNQRYLIAIALAYYKLEFNFVNMNEYYKNIDFSTFANEKVISLASKLLLKNRKLKKYYSNESKNLYDIADEFAVPPEIVVSRVKKLSLY